MTEKHDGNLKFFESMFALMVPTMMRSHAMINARDLLPEDVPDDVVVAVAKQFCETFEKPTLEKLNDSLRNSYATLPNKSEPAGDALMACVATLISNYLLEFVSNHMRVVGDDDPQLDELIKNADAATVVGNVH